MKASIFDIDQTLIDSSWVKQYLAQYKTYGAAYDAFGNKDTVIESTLEAVKFCNNFSRIIFLTGRDEVDRARTEKTLESRFGQSYAATCGSTRGC